MIRRAVPSPSESYSVTLSPEGVPALSLRADEGRRLRPVAVGWGDLRGDAGASWGSWASDWCPPVRGPPHRCE